MLIIKCVRNNALGTKNIITVVKNIEHRVEFCWKCQEINIWNEHDPFAVSCEAIHRWGAG
jgi:hypothetical protein